MLESKVSKRLCSEMKKRGWFHRRIIRTSTPGDPDHYFYKDGRVIWVETKQAGKDARDLQIYRHNQIKATGQECYVISGMEELNNFIMTIP